MCGLSVSVYVYGVCVCMWSLYMCVRGVCVCMRSMCICVWSLHMYVYVISVYMCLNVACLMGAHICEYVYVYLFQDVGATMSKKEHQQSTIVKLIFVFGFICLTTTIFGLVICIRALFYGLPGQRYKVQLLWPGGLQAGE